MLLKRFLQISSNLFAENRLLKFCVVVLTLGFVWNTYKVNDIKDKVRTVVVPPHINSKIEISGSYANESYIKEYVRYVGALLWNYSPATVRGQFSEISVSFHPSVFDAARERLYVLADQIETTRASSVYYISKITNNSDGNFIEVTGNRLLTLQDKSVESKTKSYFILYKIENGRFWIMGVEEKGEGATRPIGLAVPSEATKPSNPADASKPKEGASSNVQPN